MYGSDPASRHDPATAAGSLRVYLGAAPGVGKTYAMLREGHRLKAEGRDVVIGLVESHGRVDTELQVGDLEVIPRQVIPHGGVAIEDMDVDAILRRAPEVVLADELAHTNPPGSARPKRYQDVEVLTRHGIDVISTVNVQHLESMNEVVASITGIGVRETIPDCVLDEADEVLLVDLPVGALLARLEAGKVYPGSRADQALTGFFKEGNLTALRELALRRTAEGVDDRLADLMLEHGDALIAASDRIMVLASADRRWGGVLRTAWRLASALRGDLLVVVPAPNASLDLLPADQRTAVEANLRLAEDLGAEVMLLPDEGDSRHDLADEMARLVHRERVSMLVVGIDPHPKRGMFRRGNRSVYDLVEALVERVDALDTHLVGYEDRDRSERSAAIRHGGASQGDSPRFTH